MHEPAHWEGSQYLLEMEVDPASKPGNPRLTGRFTAAAQKAQKAKWQRLMNNRPPRKKIPPRLLASSSNTVPYLLYGWPFKKNYMVEYARRHHLVYPTTEYNRKAFGGIDEFHFDQLTDDDLKDESKMPARTSVHVEYDDMLALYSNRTIEEHIAIPELLGLFDKGKAIIHAAMNEGNTGNEVELRWWCRQWRGRVREPRVNSYLGTPTCTYNRLCYKLLRPSAPAPDCPRQMLEHARSPPSYPPFDLT
ncbi:hypothetical protein OH76DRAFT_1489646 [Lentinus brumalis]|uniref:Uncharacterized protein n=1 Tax=Lentinus brumalis TaxID=2498619 RepID=A0A371CLV2_9APHY|nr:hypothetical protein OH76DRAFT_1489646 [Polyporus brumalis]